MSSNQPGNSDRVLSFTGHLEELRWRIILCIVIFVMAIFVAFFFAPRIIGVLIRPLTTQANPPPPAHTINFRLDEQGYLRLAADVDAGDARTSMTQPGEPIALSIEVEPGAPPIILTGRSRSSLFFLSPIEPFILLIKAAILVAVIFTVPVIAYNVWRFVSPGLLQAERRAVGPVILASMLMFPLGALFAYFLANPSLTVLLSFSEYIPGLEPNIVASQYISFIMTLALAFGVLFEFPLVLILLSRLGVVSADWLAEKRRFAILFIVIAAAVATPTPDPFTLMAVVLPLLVLYEGAILVIRALDRIAMRRETVGGEDSV